MARSTAGWNCRSKTFDRIRRRRKPRGFCHDERAAQAPILRFRRALGPCGFVVSRARPARPGWRRWRRRRWGYIQFQHDFPLHRNRDRCLRRHQHEPLLVDGSGYPEVNIKAGAGSGGTALADEAAFTQGTTDITPMGASTSPHIRHCRPGKPASCSRQCRAAGGGGCSTAGTATGGVLTVQGVASMTPVQVSQATAASLNATVVGTGTFAVQATLQASATTAIGKVDPNTIATWGLANSVERPRRRMRNRSRGISFEPADLHERSGWRAADDRRGVRCTLPWIILTRMALRSALSVLPWSSRVIRPRLP